MHPTQRMYSQQPRFNDEHLGHSTVQTGAQERKREQSLSLCEGKTTYSDQQLVREGEPTNPHPMDHNLFDLPLHEENEQPTIPENGQNGQHPKQRVRRPLPPLA